MGNLGVLRLAKFKHELNSGFPPMSRYPKALILFGLLFAIVAVMMALGSAASYSDDTSLTIFFGIPAILFTSVWAVRSLIRMKMQQRWKWKWLAGAVALTFLIPCLAWRGVWRWVHPPNIRYEFSYGQSSSWGAVQFSFLANEEWREGPWVGAWHVTVRFPDLNGDGHADLRVTGNGGMVAEYIYLPEGTNGRWWHLINRRGFQVSYPPDGHSYH